ncbi:hypothetical protein WICPIJ_003228 [Wickerhamomyces pijperi]|uniref:[RNA-polymerase]-subunit kinase n=1 Tax=Wickerhamomyces pijperi TaxID=599730 RepID=A0A9P8TNW8_WICPI|nr:hypothetical protein WICPIJ_003228 [Wickerhamomyces pijperi]
MPPLYTKSKKVGEGTYAVVYLGHHTATQRPIAIKEIKAGQFKDGLDMSAIREMKYLQELRHLNIIELVDVFSSQEGDLNLVLEYLPADLEMLIKDRSILFSPGDIKSWLLMTLRGVHHCHRNHILHRDLKPNNLLLSPQGELKLADFGLARSLTSPNELLTHNVVTRWYRAPELLFESRHYTEAVDLWAVGVIFAELMLRVPYLPGRDDLDQIDVTFQALGTPTEENWSNVSSLPNYNDLKIYPEPTRSELRKRFIGATEAALDLMCGLLCLNPANRWDTERALLSGYFKESPDPTVPVDLPKLSKKE